MGGKSSREERISSVPDEVTSYLLKKLKCVFMTQNEYVNKVYRPTDIFYLERTVNVINQSNFKGASERDRYGLLGSVFSNRERYEGLDYIPSSGNSGNVNVDSRENIYKSISQRVYAKMMRDNIKILGKKNKKLLENDVKQMVNELKSRIDKKHSNWKYIDKFVKKEFKKILEELEVDYLREDHKEYLNKYIENELRVLAEKHGFIPKPIYVMYARVLEVDGNFLEDHLEDKYGELKNELRSNQVSLERTMFARYGWKGNVRVVIYIPNLKSDGRVPTNICAYRKNHLWMKTLTMSDSLLYDIYTLNSYDFKFLERSLPRNVIDMLIKKLESKNNRYYFKNDMTNMCHKHGCLSEKGENLNMLLPKYTDVEGDLNKNAKGKAPYLPQKCLIPYDFHVNGYNPKKKGKSYSEIMDKLFEKVTEKSIEKCFKEWKKNNEKLQKGEEGDYDIDADMIMQMNNCAIEYIQDKEDDKKHYSKWQPKILKELAHRNDLYPGVAEVVWPMFEVKGLDDICYNMPWGNRLIPSRYGLCEGGDIVDEIVSINMEWRLALDKSGRFGIGLYRGNSLVTVISSKRVPLDCKIQLADGRLEVLGTVGSDNKPFVHDSIKVANDAYKFPLSLVIEDNGRIIVLQDGFTSATNENFAKFIDNSLSSWKNDGVVNKVDAKNVEVKHVSSKSNVVVNKKYGEHLYLHRASMMRRLADIRDYFLEEGISS